ncbi:hypothetical protein BDW02DRAFT_423867 [Decorospora gaudefroyi]|uniref:Uncharacterized protein n=1 Tax=Decorospora gaudefroyi TaxID=184978 RepID=A0A6A5KGJ3_9PLEO|nr:hypothetical protein BDW02DRAFT_423867 [Decorospora gaudefroyi]
MSTTGNTQNRPGARNHSHPAYMTDEEFAALPDYSDVENDPTYDTRYTRRSLARSSPEIDDSAPRGIAPPPGFSPTPHHAGAFDTPSFLDLNRRHCDITTGRADSPGHDSADYHIGDGMPPRDPRRQTIARSRSGQRYSWVITPGRPPNPSTEATRRLYSRRANAPQNTHLGESELSGGNEPQVSMRGGAGSDEELQDAPQSAAISDGRRWLQSLQDQGDHDPVPWSRVPSMLRSVESLRASGNTSASDPDVSSDTPADWDIPEQATLTLNSQLGDASPRVRRSDWWTEATIRQSSLFQERLDLDEGSLPGQEGMTDIPLNHLETPENPAESSSGLEEQITQNIANPTPSTSLSGQVTPEGQGILPFPPFSNDDWDGGQGPVDSLLTPSPPSLGPKLSQEPRVEDTRDASGAVEPETDTANQAAQGGDDAGGADNAGGGDDTGGGDDAGGDDDDADDHDHGSGCCACHCGSEKCWACMQNIEWCGILHVCGKMLCCLLKAGLLY